jgi:predicted O-methyltransferase YrrM
MEGASPVPDATCQRSADAQTTEQSIRLAYATYVTSVSHPVHAISLQLAFYLWELLTSRHPRRLADLGSGFSSYVLRLYARLHDPTVEVWSVDDDPRWLDETHRFLDANGLATDRMVLWSDFAQIELDLALHDLGSMATRKATLSEALTIVRPGGVLVLDDVHMPQYRAFVETTLTETQVPCQSVRDQTQDMFGRYSWLALPGDGSGRPHYA